MLRRIALLAVALSPVAVLAFASTPAKAGGPTACPNLYAVEPLVMWDVTGFSFFGGLLHEHLVVYSNGTAAISTASDDNTSATGAQGKVAFVDPAKAQRFLRELASAGAFDLCDQNLIVNDIPLTTLTVFKGATDATSHTFSYWTGDAPYDKVASVVSAFIASTFPGF